MKKMWFLPLCFLLISCVGISTTQTTPDDTWSIETLPSSDQTTDAVVDDEWSVDILSTEDADNANNDGWSIGTLSENETTDDSWSTDILPDSKMSQTNMQPIGETAEVVYVVDGDTILVDIDNDQYRVRYIGVDTPERDEPYYQEATQFNRDLVDGEIITLVKDISDTDQYGRLLRYIYLDDGTFVNEQLIANGYARLVTYAPDTSNADYFATLQREAREASLGLWDVNDFMQTDQQAPAGCNLCNRNAYNCRDFNSQSAAQACYQFCYEVSGKDIHKLDGGGDGVVCESLDN